MGCYKDNVEAVEKNNTESRTKEKNEIKYSTIQDIDLCHSWLLTISNNGVDYYNQYRNEGLIITISQACNHWYKFSADVSKFNGYYIQVKEIHPSGHDDINKSSVWQWNCGGVVITIENFLIYIL